jgi:nitroreductase
METWDAVCSRRNVREFDDRQIDQADLDLILEAGRRAPSAKNWQPWDFVVLTDRKALGDLSKVWKGAWHVANSAAAIGLVLPTTLSADKQRVAQFDLGQVCAMMQLVAADLGIGSGHASVGDADLARGLVGLPDDRELARILDFGYPADRPLSPTTRLDRRDFAEVVHRDRW